MQKLRIKTPASDWRQQLAQVITDPAVLLEQLQLDKALLPAAQRATRLFALRVPHAFVARMQPKNPHDPLLRQVLPLDAEFTAHSGYSADPLQERQSNPLPGLLHKYESRVLLTFTSACAVNCRYCFRRHFPYKENNPSRADWQAVLDYITERPAINEVILSGGEPLLVQDEYLADFIKRIENIAHVNTLRIHTRMPVVIPARITQGFCEVLSNTRLQVVCVIHCNHAQEIDAYLSQQLQTLRAAGVTLLNQSVLLRGVNDSTQRLVDLSHALFAAGVLPYYLHVLDKVQGAAHFAVDLSEAQNLWQQLQAKTSGYLVPRLVCEQAGQASKTLITMGA